MAPLCSNLKISEEKERDKILNARSVLHCKRDACVYRELSDFKKRRIVDMLEAVWSQAAKHLGRVGASFKHSGTVGNMREILTIDNKDMVVTV